MAGEYVCTLNEKSLEKAKRELNEDPADRLNAVESFRQLIKTRAPHITCSLETEFLLRFLRVAKFSQLEALKRLERYLELFNVAPEWLRDIDLSDKRIQAFIDTGYFIPLGFDDDGCAVAIQDLGSFDTKSKDYDKNTIVRTILGVSVMAAYDENSVVNGVRGLMDLTKFTVKHQTFWDLESTKFFTKVMNGSWPGRWKNFYYYNCGPVFETLMAIASPFLKPKMKERLVFIGSNLEAVYDKHIPMRLLPVEYLPDDYTGPNNGTIKECIQRLKDDMLKPEAIARVKYETSDAFRLDESKRPKDDPPLATFRKLNVD